MRLLCSSSDRSAPSLSSPFTCQVKNLVNQTTLSNFVNQTTLSNLVNQTKSHQSNKIPSIKPNLVNQGKSRESNQISSTKPDLVYQTTLSG